MAYLVQESELSVYKDSFVFTPTSQQPRGREPSLRINRTSGEIDSIGTLALSLDIDIALSLSLSANSVSVMLL